MGEKYNHIKTINDVELALQNEKFIPEFANNIINIITKIIDPFEEKSITYNVNKATVIGLYTKLFKYYKLYIKAYLENENESSSLLSRPLYECFVLMKYLIKKGDKSQYHYRLVSYRRRYKNIKELEKIDGIGQVLLDKTKTAMIIDNFSISDFEAEDNKKKGRKWELDGKNFSEIHKEVEISESYKYLYGMTSEIIHSGWGDIRQSHLTFCEGDLFVAKLEFNKYNDISIITPFFSILTEASQEFLTWSERESELIILSEYERVSDLLNRLIIEKYRTNPEYYLTN